MIDDNLRKTLMNIVKEIMIEKVKDGEIEL